MARLDYERDDDRAYVRKVAEDYWTGALNRDEAFDRLSSVIGDDAAELRLDTIDHLRGIMAVAMEPPGQRYARLAHPCAVRTVEDKLEFLWSDYKWHGLWPVQEQVPTFDGWPEVEIGYEPVYKQPGPCQLHDYGWRQYSADTREWTPVTPRTAIREWFTHVNEPCRGRRAHNNKGFYSKWGQRRLNTRRQLLRLISSDEAAEAPDPTWSLSLLGSTAPAPEEAR